MVPQGVKFEQMLNIRYRLKDDPSNRLHVFMRPIWQGGQLLAPHPAQVAEAWCKIKASHDAGAMQLPYDGKAIDVAELIEGGYYNTTPGINGRGMTVTKILGTQVCDGVVIASYGKGKPEVIFPWMKEPEPEPETVTTDLPEVEE